VDDFKELTSCAGLLDFPARAALEMQSTPPGGDVVFRVSKSILTVLILLPACAWAGKHPVPLEKNTDGAKCVECHEDKAKGKAVHSAIATGCTSCHEIRVNKEITRVKLTTTTPQALCLTCHADKNAAEIKGKVHPPAVRDCLKCHDPHTSENKFNLKLAAEGQGPKENLCLTCHRIGMDVPKDGSRHAALDMGCSTCHTTHKTGEKGNREFDYHLTKATPQLCFDCHDPKDAGLQKAHNNQPFDKADCLTCHDPHQSAKPKLMQAFVHAPFSDKDSCSTCHKPAENGKVVLTEKDAKSLCLTCHEDKGKQIESAKVQHPGAVGDCTDCHSPHAGKSPGFPKPNAVDVCLGCHSDQAEQHKKKFPHQPVFGQGCATCHEPHGGDHEHLLRAANINSLCLECHGPESKPKRLKEEHLVTIFDGKVRLPEQYFDIVPKLPIKYGLGHPVDKHPVQDQMDLNDATKVRVAVNCGTCHQPHGSNQPDLLVKDQANSMVFCAGCHKDLGK
jgi:predicted CXXCH cytochrome family protein